MNIGGQYRSSDDDDGDDDDDDGDDDHHFWWDLGVLWTLEMLAVEAKPTLRPVIADTWVDTSYVRRYGVEEIHPVHHHHHHRYIQKFSFAQYHLSRYENLHLHSQTKCNSQNVGGWMSDGGCKQWSGHLFNAIFPYEAGAAVVAGRNEGRVRRYGDAAQRHFALGNLDKQPPLHH